MINLLNRFLSKNNINKAIIIIVFTYLNAFSGYFPPMYGHYMLSGNIELLTPLLNSITLTISIIGFFLFTHFILRLFKGEGKIIDTLLVGSLSSLFVTFYGFLFLIITILGNSLNIVTKGAMSLLIIIFFFLSIYNFQKGLKIIHNISNNKITLSVIISVLIYYFGINPIIIKFLG